MKKIICIFLITVSGLLNAQEVFKAGMLAGISTSQVHGDTYSGFNKIGFIAGVFVKKQFHELWDFKFEVMYIEKGSRHIARPEKGDYNSYYLNLNYMEVPLVFCYYYKKFRIEGGLAFGALVKWKEEDAYGAINYPDNFKKTDFSHLIGIGAALTEKITVRCRYINSFLPVREFRLPVYYRNWLYNQFNRGLYNNVLSFTLHYQL